MFLVVTNFDKKNERVSDKKIGWKHMVGIYKKCKRICLNIVTSFKIRKRLYNLVICKKFVNCIYIIDCILTSYNK